MSRDREKESQGSRDAVIGVTTSENVGRYGYAASEYIKGYKGTRDAEGKLIKKGLKQVADSKVHPDHEYRNLKQQAGFSAEIHYTDKVNAEHIINKSSERVSRANNVGLGNHEIYDILSVDADGRPVFINDEPGWGAQMKFCGRYETDSEVQKSAENIVGKLASKKWDKYRGKPVLIPSEQVDQAKQVATEKAKSLMEQAKYCREKGQTFKANQLEEKAAIFFQVADDITDSGISSEEAMFLREHPKLATSKYVAQTANRAGLEQAKAAAVMSATISTSQNIIAVIKGDKEINEALKDVAVDTLSGSVSGYVIGAGDTAIRSCMAASKNSAFKSLSKTTLPATIATVSVQVVKSLIRYANGEIDSVELTQELGEKGTGMLAASWGAAIGTMIFPGIGTAVGGMVGYMTSSILYGSAMQVLKEEKISSERRKLIEAISAAAKEAMIKQGIELQMIIDQFYQEREMSFARGIALIDKGMQYNDLQQFTRGLNQIAIEMGGALQFTSFEEFDAFMNDKEAIFEF